MSNTTPPGVFARVDGIELQPAPIEPSWVLSGRPEARAGNHSENVDGWAATTVWDCTAGRFRWYFGWEETVYILEGEVRVTDAAGQTTTLRAGELGYFPALSWWTWEVDQYVRKIAFCRRQVPRLTRAVFALRANLRLRERLLGRKR